MQLALFGATGTVGSRLLGQALSGGHTVKALVRRPESLDPVPPGTEIVHGHVADGEAVRSTVAGCDAVLSALGGTGRRSPELLQQGTAAVLEAMGEAGLRRIVVVQGFHLPFAGDPPSIGRRVVTTMLRLANRHLLEDSLAMARLLAASQASWTLVRAPRIVRTTSRGHVHTGRMALGPWHSVAAVDVASFMLGCVEHERHVHDAPMIVGVRGRREAAPSGIGSSPPRATRGGRCSSSPTPSRSGSWQTAR